MTLESVLPYLGLVGIGVLLMGGQLLPVMRSLRTRFWNATTATILEAEMVPLRSPMAMGSRGLYTAHTLSVRYTYVVSGIPYTSTRFGFHGYRPSSRDIARILRAYPPDASVRIWYNPSDPKEAVLVRGPGALNLIGLIFGLYALVVGVLGLYLQVAT
jgi:hypothetical protein